MYEPSGLISTVPLLGIVVGMVSIVMLSPFGSPSFANKSPSTGISIFVIAASLPAYGGILSPVFGTTSIITIAVSHNTGIPSSQMT